jgi:hypothetical protein
MIESLEQEDINLSAALYWNNDQTFIDVEDPLTITPHQDKDTMYWDEAMAQKDAPQWRKHTSTNDNS